MGWLRDSGEDWSYDHEGYMVAVEQPERGGEWRELGGPADEARRVIPVSYVQVACSCGWRSPRLVAPIGTEWVPCSVMTSGAVDDLAYQIWADEHRDLLHERSPYRLLKPSDT